jgi:hypothetical protein
MNWIFSRLLILFLLALPTQAALGASAKVSGGFGCDRGSEGAICFDDGCVCGFILRIDGEIVAATVEQVRKLFAVRRAIKGSYSESFYINSFGGSVTAAMEIGRMFRTERAWISLRPDMHKQAAVWWTRTRTPELERAGNCVSACVLILAGAVERNLWLGRVGIHRPYLDTTPQKPVTVDEAREGYGRLLHDLRGYLREMNVSERLADDMLAVEPEKVRYLNKAELEAYGLANIDHIEQQTRAIEKEMQDVQASNQLGLTRREYTRRKALGNDLCSQVEGLREVIDCKDRVLRTGR